MVGEIEEIEFWRKTVMKRYPNGQYYIDKSQTSEWIKYAGKVRDVKKNKDQKNKIVIEPLGEEQEVLWG